MPLSKLPKEILLRIIHFTILSAEGRTHFILANEYGTGVMSFNAPGEYQYNIRRDMSQTVLALNRQQDQHARWSEEAYERAPTCAIYIQYAAQKYGLKMPHAITSQILDHILPADFNDHWDYVLPNGKCWWMNKNAPRFTNDKFIIARVPRIVPNAVMQAQTLRHVSQDFNGLVFMAIQDCVTTLAVAAEARSGDDFVPSLRKRTRQHECTIAEGLMLLIEGTPAYSRFVYESGFNDPSDLETSDEYEDCTAASAIFMDRMTLPFARCEWCQNRLDHIAEMDWQDLPMTRDDYPGPFEGDLFWKHMKRINKMRAL